MNTYPQVLNIKVTPLHKIDLRPLPKSPFVINAKDFLFPLEWGEYEIYDFSKGYDPNRALKNIYGVGRYDERRPNMYNGQQYKNENNEVREIHMGIDLAAPAGSDVRAFARGDVISIKYNALPYDYGGTLLTSHTVEVTQTVEQSLRLSKRQLYVLWGHLSFTSLSKLQIGQSFERGELLAKLGSAAENGGWNPHLHIQLSWLKPLECDLPGAVSSQDHQSALQIFPDPRSILGSLY